MEFGYSLFWEDYFLKAYYISFSPYGLTNQALYSHGFCRHSGDLLLCIRLLVWS